MRLYLIWLLLGFFAAENAISQPKAHTASSRVHIIDTAFAMPELGRSRRIWIYLPEGNKGEKFPVLYMQDGQNLFDQQTSFAGEWGIDEFMDSTLLPKCIIIGIDNGGAHRIHELTPYDMEKYGKAEGDAYLRFLVKTLKPFIDSHYPVLKKRKDTWIGGSSLGGLISFYAMLKYPKTFGGAAVFSPSFWIAPKIYEEAKSSFKKMKAAIYFYAGKKEGGEMVPDMLRMMDLVSHYPGIKATATIREEGKHQEASWRQEFPLFYGWLMSKKH